MDKCFVSVRCYYYMFGLIDTFITNFAIILVLVLVWYELFRRLSTFDNQFIYIYI